MTTDPNSFQLTPEQLSLLGKFSAETGKSPAEVLSEALDLYGPQANSAAASGSTGDSFYDKLARKGLIGCLSGGPPDLSTNPKYMEGFGRE